MKQPACGCGRFSNNCSCAPHSRWAAFSVSQPLLITDASESNFHNCTSSLSQIWLKLFLFFCSQCLTWDGWIALHISQGKFKQNLPKNFPVHLGFCSPCTVKPKCLWFKPLTRSYCVTVSELRHNQLSLNSLNTKVKSELKEQHCANQKKKKKAEQAGLGRSTISGDRGEGKFTQSYSTFGRVTKKTIGR